MIYVLKIRLQLQIRYRIQSQAVMFTGYILVISRAAYHRGIVRAQYRRRIIELYAVLSHSSLIISLSLLLDATPPARTILSLSMSFRSFYRLRHDNVEDGRLEARGHICLIYLTAGLLLGIDVVQYTRLDTAEAEIKAAFFKEHALEFHRVRIALLMPVLSIRGPSRISESRALWQPCRRLRPQHRPSFRRAP